jgi:membrane dipeptidase
MTIPDVECFDLSQVVNELSEWFYKLRAIGPSNAKLVTTVKEIKEAKKNGSVAVILGSQGAGFLGLNLSILDFFYRLGMRTMQPTYQQRNQFGNGCGEKNDSGLSNLGVNWVEEMNRIGMVISLSHAGLKTSFDIMEISKDPVIFDHSNSKILCDTPRNLTDEQIRSCDEKGGVIGLCPIAGFISTDKVATDQSVEDFIKHINYVVDLVGVDHAGFGLDLEEGFFHTPETIIERRSKYPGIGSKASRKLEDEFLKSGREKLYAYEKNMPWLNSISNVSIITEALLQKGYSDKDVEKIMGHNFLRVFKKVWGK